MAIKFYNCEFYFLIFNVGFTARVLHFLHYTCKFVYKKKPQVFLPHYYQARRLQELQNCQQSKAVIHESVSCPQGGKSLKRKSCTTCIICRCRGERVVVVIKNQCLSVRKQQLISARRLWLASQAARPPQRQPPYRAREREAVHNKAP